MIRRLRQRHRLLTGALVLPLIGAGIALASRPAVPVMDALPPPLAAGAPSASAPLWSAADRWIGAVIATTLHPDQVVLTPIEPLRRPDCLLYWSPRPAEGDGLPGGAVLLGAISGDAGQHIPLPAAARADDGVLLIYSLGHSTVVASLALGGQP
jgi:hypothetical protein